MTDPINEQDPQGGGPTPAGPARAASVQLRERGEGETSASLMDPANQSLAEALRITFRLLQLAMVVLVVLYFGSGLQSIRANERGVRLIFGKIAASDLRPGFHWAAPYPIGELVKVDVGITNQNIDRAFWPYVEPGKENAGIDGLRSRASLSPEQDGSMLTGDGAIAHTQWKVQYTRANAGLYAQNVYPPHETGIVRAAVQRGIVQAVAGVEIDALLKQSATGEGSVASRAKSISQGLLDRIGVKGTGIEVEQLSLESKIPPVYLRDAFNSVLEATSKASKAREDAQKEGNTLLSNTAGAAAPVLIELIDRYQQEIDAGEADAAASTLALIDRVFVGESVEVAGATVNPPLGGDVARILSEARQYRSAVQDRAKSELTVFQAKLEQFKTNPTVMVTADWTEAMGMFFSDPRLEIHFVPAGTDTLELVINGDPEIAARNEQARRQKDNEEARQKRNEEMERSRYNTQSGLRDIPG